MIIMITTVFKVSQFSDIDKNRNVTWSIATGRGIVAENFSIPSSSLVIQVTQIDSFILYCLNSANTQTIQQYNANNSANNANNSAKQYKHVKSDLVLNNQTTPDLLISLLPTMIFG